MASKTQICQIDLDGNTFYFKGSKTIYNETASASIGITPVAATDTKVKPIIEKGELIRAGAAFKLSVVIKVSESKRVTKQILVAADKIQTAIAYYNGGSANIDSKPVTSAGFKRDKHYG